LAFLPHESRRRASLEVETRMHQGNDEHIRRKAYEIWESEGRPEGRHDDHWRRARENFRKDKGAAETSGDTSATARPGDTPAAGAHADDMHTQDKAMIPQNSAEHLTQTEPKAEPAPPSKRPRTQRKKTSAS
jgi:hypothetical protein